MRGRFAKKLTWEELARLCGPTACPAPHNLPPRRESARHSAESMLSAEFAIVVGAVVCDFCRKRPRDRFE
jgi:hypothetical protein